MSYGKPSSVNIEDSSVIYSLDPGIYLEGSIVSIKKDDIGREGEEKPVIAFVFQSADGKKHDHVEWMQDDDDKIKNQLARIGSYMRQLNPEYAISEEGFESWDGYRDHIAAQMTPERSKVKVDFKIVANVYNPTKPKTQLPNYKGAVVASSKKTPLKFSASELANNAQYKKILSGEFSAGLPAADELIDEGGIIDDVDQII